MILLLSLISCVISSLQVFGQNYLTLAANLATISCNSLAINKLFPVGGIKTGYNGFGAFDIQTERVEKVPI